MVFQLFIVNKYLLCFYGGRGEVSKISQREPKCDRKCEEKGEGGGEGRAGGGGGSESGSVTEKWKEEG
jgi:hypothetical protein